MRVRMMAIAGALAGAATLFAGSAYAGDPMANFYGNTFLATDQATGLTAKFFINKDHTYTRQATDKAGKTVTTNGTWSLKDNDHTLCLAQKAPAMTTCGPIAPYKVGDTWTESIPPRTYSDALKAGR